MMWEGHPSKMLVATHRGQRFTAPENTLSSFHLCRNTEAFYKLYHFVRRKFIKCRIHKIRISGSIFYMLLAIGRICYITASFARYSYFFADNIVFFKYINAVAKLACMACRKHSCRTCAYYRYLHLFSPTVLKNCFHSVLFPQDVHCHSM